MVLCFAVGIYLSLGDLFMHAWNMHVWAGSRRTWSSAGFHQCHHTLISQVFRPHSNSSSYFVKKIKDENEVSLGYSGARNMPSVFLFFIVVCFSFASSSNFSSKEEYSVVINTKATSFQGLSSWHPEGIAQPPKCGERDYPSSVYQG